MKKAALFLIIVLISLSFITAQANIRRDYIEARPAKDYITEAEFGSVISLLHHLYDPIFLKVASTKLNMHADWLDDTVNAYATRELKIWSVHVSGGIARAEGMNQDSLAFIVCHEIGHHLGGAPLSHRFSGWPTAEGQADYWATSKCLKKYYHFLKDETFFIDSEIPTQALKDCSTVYPSSVDYRICVRTMNSIAAFARFLNALPDTKQFVSILTPDKRQVRGTNHNDYPRPQCRIDTVYSGALCYLDADLQTSAADQRVGHCNDYNKLGARPRCWFKP